MDAYKETFATWNKVASIYQEKFMDLDLYDASYDLVCESVKKKNAKILEIGCGPGNITRYLLSKRSDFQIFGIDVSPNMIQLARKNNPTADFEVMDAREIGKIDSKFDGIICGFCLPYLAPEDLEKFLADACDLLLPNGIFYISFVEGKSENSGFKTTKTGDRVYFNYYGLDKLMCELEKLKFSHLKTFHVQYPLNENESEMHTILVVKKMHKNKKLE